MQTQEKKILPAEYRQAALSWAASFALHNQDDTIHMLRVSSAMLRAAGLITTEKYMEIFNETDKYV